MKNSLSLLEEIKKYAIKLHANACELNRLSQQVFIPEDIHKLQNEQKKLIAGLVKAETSFKQKKTKPNTTELKTLDEIAEILEEFETQNSSFIENIAKQMKIIQFEKDEVQQPQNVVKKIKEAIKSK